MDERIYEVEGMTCDHCRRAVIEEVVGVEGVDHVAVDLEAGRVVVRGEDVDDAGVAAAVSQAGYLVRR